MGRKLGLDGQAVAYAVLEQILEEPVIQDCWVSGSKPSYVADHLLRAADVEFQPRARKLILTFDLSDPDDPGPTDGKAYVGVDDEPVPFVPVDAGQSAVADGS